jgi:phosphatidylserine/phosphatidylglycerophosphate/cardiolipin synthase-like enzyme
VAAGHAEAVFSPGEACLRRLTGLLLACRRRADICVFTISDDRIAQAILEAHRRGVGVRVLTDNEKLHDAGSDVDRLAAAGIPVRIDESEAHLHHKFAVFDRQFIVTGSYNWTRSAASVNWENLVVLSDPRLIASFEQEFDRLWELHPRL